MLSLGLRSLAPLRRLPPLRTLFLSAARRDASAAAALLDEPHTAALHSDADVADAIQAACQALGRQSGDAEDGLATKLRDNWYSTAADVAGMSDAQAASLGVPLRLRDTIALELAAAAAPPPAALQGRAMPAAAAELLDAALDAGAPSWADAADIGSEDEGAGAAAPPAAAKDVEQPGWEQLPIELRVCPALARKGFKLSEARNVSKRARGAPYALSEAEMSPALRAELEALTAFATQRFFGAQAEPIAPVTAAKYCDHLRGMLGWTHRVGGVPLDRLSLAALVPSAERAAVAPAFAYVQWLTKERAISVRTEGLVLRAVMAAAKFLYHSQSRVQAGSGDKPYSDLEVVKELRGLSNATRKASKVAARTSDEALKWQDWPTFLATVRELRRECAGLAADGATPRGRKAVAWSLQRYLIFAIFSCVPDRQRTLRELEVGRTLVREEGRWLIRHGPGDYKTGRSYGERPPLVIAPDIYPELEAFIGEWRAELEPSHNLLFTQRSGGPLTDKSLYELFWKVSYRLTGRRTNPHLLRDSIVTFLRGSGNASERELEALSLYMGHSMEMQRSSYDRRTKQQKVEPAVALLEALNARARGPDRA